MTMRASETIEDAVRRTGGRTRGFDYLRIILALGVLVWHSARACYPGFGMGPILRPTAGMILPMFFALSGFLVSGSLLRSRSIQEFVALRGIRLVPALTVETLLSMVVIGALFTTLPIVEFFSHPQTHMYLLNMLGTAQMLLPGVFKDHPIDAVNLSLWTVPFELECYLLIVFLWVTRIYRNRFHLLLATIFIQVAIPLFDVYRGYTLDPTRPLSGRLLVLSFLCGVLIFAYRDRIKLNRYLFAAALACCAVCLLVGPLSYYVCFPAAYVTVYLGMMDPPKIPVILDGDYSYGVYLYAFPIQQMVYQLSPDALREWWWNAGISLILVAACAAGSWRLIEKPILDRRRVIVAAFERGLERLMFWRRPAIAEPPRAAESDA